MRRAIHTITLVLFLLSGLLLKAQDQEAVTFTLELSKDHLGVDERLQADFTMNRDRDHFLPPDFEGFRVVTGPTQSVSSTWVNGVRSFSKTYSYVLAPKAKGSYTIGQGTIVIGGKTYKTLPRKVTITDRKKDG